MAVIKETLDALYITFKNIFRKPVTVMYPRDKRPFPERMRGVFAQTVNPETGEENCIGCRLCEMICPSKVIKVIPEKRENRSYSKEFTLDMGGCMFCELCVQVCPSDAIVMTKNVEFSTLTREELVLSKEKLLENGRKYVLSANTGNFLRKMQTPPRVEVKREGGKG